ncbi:hypothetical protein B7463_g8883, partial [Scytalidium lignicola]
MEQATSTMSSGDGNPLDSTGLCLLSLDGGGVRGLSTLYVLKSIMARLNHERNKTNLPPVKPCEVFDLIGGTSTGGLIAIMLGRLEMSVDECIAAYSELAGAVFGKRQSSISFNLAGNVKSRFDSAKLESAIRKVVVDRGVPETDLLNDGTERGCRTFVCTVDRDTKDIVRLRSYTLPHELNIRATICQAALATSAATTFFDPVSIGDRSFADGALGSNNPVDEVEGEAANIWCSETGDLKPLVKCFISIGTGNPGKKAFKNSIIQFLGQTVVQIATETENTEKKFIARWAKHFDEKRYFRFNVEQGLQDIGLDEYKKKGAIEGATRGYLDHTAQKFRISFATVVNEYMMSKLLLQSNPSKPLRILPFGQNENFVGRQSHLDRLIKIFHTNNTEQKCQRAALDGLGGVGKTQIALQFAFLLQEISPAQCVFWVQASDLSSFENSYRRIGEALGIPAIDDDKADLKTLVKQELSKESKGRWLLIIDNADDAQLFQTTDDTSSSLAEYLPYSKLGGILFTTRDHKVATEHAEAEVIPIDMMDEAESKELLRISLQNKAILNDTESALMLLKLLTNLPLAIKQAAAFINEKQINIATYISIYETMRNWLNIKKELHLASTNTLKRIADIFPWPEHDNKNIWTAYLPHAQSIFALTKDLDGVEESHNMLLRSIGHCLYISGKYSEAEPIYRQTLALRKKVLGPEHPNTLMSMNNLAMLLDSQGKYDEAEPIFRQTLALSEKVLGPEHPNTLNSMNNLAALATRRQGKIPTRLSPSTARRWP